MTIASNIIEIAINWWDDDLIEYCVSASNGNFSGAVNVYATHDDLSDFAKTIKGFPKIPNDTCQFELGNFDPKSGGGGVRFNFSTSDSLGHVVIVLDMQCDAHRSRFVQEMASFAIQAMPSDIDTFINSLRSFKLQRGNSIRLPHAP